MEEKISISSVLNEGLIDLHVKGTTKDEVLEELVDLLVKEQCISSKELFLEDVYMREEEGITGIGDGVAIPHGKSDAVLRTAVALGRSDTAIEWNSVDDKPVRLVIMLAIKSLDKTVHIRLLSKIATSLCEPCVIQELLRCTDEKKVISLFEKGGECL